MQKMNEPDDPLAAVCSERECYGACVCALPVWGFYSDIDAGAFDATYTRAVAVERRAACVADGAKCGKVQRVYGHSEVMPAE